MTPLQRFSLLCLFWPLLSVVVPAHGAPNDYFQVSVADADTGRGVPLVELRTTNDITYYTDSSGVVALDDPELMGRTVYFAVSSHGYEYPADGFGYRGKALRVTPGGRARLEIRRVNIAERLYRLTGAGIYRDSVLTGVPVPIKQPLMDGLVMGQDTVEVTPYRGRLYWFFGDTSRPSYPLGQFATSGATSALPGAGGLDPGRGVDLAYWVDSDGFSKKMIPLPAFGGPVWVGGLFTLADGGGRERLLTHYVHLDGAGKVAEQGLAAFNDQRAVFEKVQTFAPGEPLVPEGHPFRAAAGGRAYLYFEPTTGGAMPLVRVPADMAHVRDPRTYQGFTCLAPGSRFDGARTRVDRGPDGRLVYGWKAGTPVLSYDQQQELLKDGLLKTDEAPFLLRDVETGMPIRSHNGSTFWNAYRRRWVMISSQEFGDRSFLGEIWFAEADTPTGPWVYARRIITHDHYSFYNPTQHPFFDQDGGRLIYLEGTYTDTFSGNPVKTPRYNYNQIMYRLALDDPRLALPAPVYRLRGPGGTEAYGTRETVDPTGAWARVEAIPFFAIPPTRRHDGLVPLYAVPNPHGGTVLRTAATDAGKPSPPLCFVLPSAAPPGEKPSPDVVPLYEFTDAATGGRRYETTGSGTPLCRVWRNPSSVLAFDPDEKRMP